MPLMKYLIFSILFLSSLFLKSQSIDSIASVFSKRISNEFLTKLKYENKTKFKIKFTALYNENGNQTQLSDKLGFNIGKYLQKDLNDVIIRKFYFNINTSYSLNNQTLAEIQKYDYTLTGFYKLTNNSIIFSKFTLTEIANNKKIVFNDYKIKLNNTSQLKQLDSLSLEDYNTLLSLERTYNFTRNIRLSENGNKLTPRNYDGIGDVYEVDFDTDYNLNFSLEKDCYIYAFFYDPQDEDYHYPLVIEHPEKIYTKGEYKNFLEYPMYFVNTGSGGDFFYIKIFFTDTKIDTKQIYSTKIIDGAESTVLTQNGCNRFINIINNIDNVQTETLILTTKK